MGYSIQNRAPTEAAEIDEDLMCRLLIARLKYFCLCVLMCILAALAGSVANA